jgi:hypothetical protein
LLERCNHKKNQSQSQSQANQIEAELHTYKKYPAVADIYYERPLKGHIFRPTRTKAKAKAKPTKRPTNFKRQPKRSPYLLQTMVKQGDIFTLKQH